MDDFIGIPPRGQTATNMWVLKRQILQFAHFHGELPHSLTNLPAFPETRRDYNYTRDGWGREIAFEVSTSGIVTLRSLGRDEVVEGSGEDADMVASFPVRDSQGRWSEEVVQWSNDPFRDDDASNDCSAIKH